MNYRVWPVTSICLGLAISLGTVAAQVQAPPAAEPAHDQVANAPQLKLSPSKQLENFEPAAGEEYQLGAGDEINLNFPGRPELSKKYTVGPDGRITLPIAGQIVIADHTRDAAGKAIVDALVPYYKDLTVTVEIEKYGSNRVTIMGDVQRPGVFSFDSTPTLLDLISKAGIQATPSNKEGLPEQCYIYRGKDQVASVDLRSLLHSGSTLADMRLRRNDIVYVPTQADRFVSVLGEVAHPGAVPLTNETTLPSALALAGGLGEGAGNSPNIQIIQKSTGKIRVIPFKQMMTPAGISEVSLQPGDVIFIPKTGFYKATYYLQRISPVTSLMTMGAMAGGVP